ncbi:hypothetical protein COH54_08750 [Neisseria meningitidis]|nr:hypothetical protein COH54_08750 [Neisseria meningitidis]
MLLSNGLDSRLRGNDGLEVARNLKKKKKNRNRTSRIPACAGMTAERFLFFPINAAISNPVIPTNLHPVIPTKVGI